MCRRASGCRWPWSSSLALWPVIGGRPAGPADSLGAMVGWILREVIIGLTIGALLRIFTDGPGRRRARSCRCRPRSASPRPPIRCRPQPGTTIAAFLMLLGTVLIFATNTHHLFIAGLVGSYTPDRARPSR